MSAEENKATTRRINDEAWTNGSLDVIDEVLAEDYVHTVVGAPEPIRGRAGFRDLVTTYRNAFPDFRVTTEEQIGEGNVVVTRWTATGTHQGDLMGMPATGKQGDRCRKQDRSLCGREARCWVGDVRPAGFSPATRRRPDTRRLTVEPGSGVSGERWRSRAARAWRFAVFAQPGLPS